MIENESNVVLQQKTVNTQIGEQEIDLVEILHKIIRIRKIIYKAIAAGLVIGVIVALSIPKEYTVKVTLSPEMGTNKNGNGIAGLAASFLGGSVSSGDGVDALNASLSSEIVSSTPFLMELLIINIPSFEDGSLMTLDSYLDEQSSPWWSLIMDLPRMLIGGVKSLFTSQDVSNMSEEIEQGAIELTKDISTKINILRNSITAKIDNKTAITSISVTLQNPKIAAVVADSVVRKLQGYIVNYRIFKAKEDCAYLEALFKERQKEYYIAQKKYADYVDTHDNLILQSIRVEQERLQNDMNIAYQVYSQVANQLQLARAKVQEEKPVFAVLEPAVVPLTSSGIGLKAYVLIFVFLGIVCTISWELIGRDFWNMMKTRMKA